MRILPSDNDKAVLAGTAVLLLGIVILLVYGVKSDAVDILVSATTTLMAAFWGAKYAFTLQNQKEFEERIKEQVAAANKVIFNLINLHNQLCNYRDQFINEFRDSPFRHLGILPAVGLGNVKEIDVDSLAFVLENEKRNILMELSLFQFEACATFEVIRERSIYHVSKIQETLEGAGFGSNDFAHIDDIHAVLGPLKTTTIKKYTDQMIESTDNAIAQSEQLIDNLRSVLKEILPGRVIVGMQKPNNPNNNAPAAPDAASRPGF